MRLILVVYLFRKWDGEIKQLPNIKLKNFKKIVINCTNEQMEEWMK